ncbi:hypothetical protein FUSO7_01075 [Fusobacterium necrophorum BFTR-2]|nr:hypothetical protein [Fusobacterium necrophorum]KDE74789.1 hypothetical protein FUSO7_01075 [Fusobacterium necrophorum BFTR-2]
MAEFRGQRITNAGRNLLGRALAKEGKFIFTKAKMGDKKIIGNPDEATDLASPKLDMKIIDVSNDQGTVKVIVSVTNKDLQESFNTEEFGLFAKIDGDLQDVMYSYATAIRPDGIPNNRLGVTLEQVHEIYLTFSSDIEATININDPLLYMTAAIANKRYVPTGLLERGELSKQTQLKEDCQYLASDGKWYHNIGGNRKWNSTGNPDEKLVHISWKTLISLYQKIKEKLSNLKLTWESIENKPKEFPPTQHKHEEYEPKIEDKKSGYNLDKTDSYEYDLPNKVASGRALYNLWQAARRLTGAIELTWDSITGKPRVFPPQSHYHDDRYAKMNHDHDNSYASKWHSHSNYESSFSKNTAFNKNFGIEEGTVLEGKRLAESMGVTKYGGLIKEYGKKYQDYAYYDDNTKEMFYCTENNNLTNPSASYFKPFSNKAILNRLENLYKIQMVFDGTHTSNGYICRLPEGWLICNIEAYFGYQNSGTMTIFNTNRDDRIYDLELGGDGSEGSIKIKNNELYLNGRGVGADMVIHRISVLISSN